MWGAEWWDFRIDLSRFSFSVEDGPAFFPADSLAFQPFP
jgi:hypothetical protein